MSKVRVSASTISPLIPMNAQTNSTATSPEIRGRNKGLYESNRAKGWWTGQVRSGVGRSSAVYLAVTVRFSSLYHTPRFHPQQKLGPAIMAGCVSLIRRSPDRCSSALLVATGWVDRSRQRLRLISRPSPNWRYRRERCTRSEAPSRTTAKCGKAGAQDRMSCGCIRWRVCENPGPLQPVTA